MTSKKLLNRPALGRRKGTEQTESGTGTRIGRSAGVRMCLGTAIVIGAALVGLLVRARGFDDAFRVWNVPTYGQPFLDMAIIPGTAQSYAEGFDPTVLNPHDPLKRVFNYPRVWYLVFHLGITHAWTVPVALTVIAFFLVAVVAFPGRLDPLAATLLFLGLVSPAAMLGIARANTDLLIFALMVLSLILVQAAPAAAIASLLIAVLFKIVPVLGCGEFLGNEREESLRRIFIVVFLSVLYFGVTLQDLFFIFGHTQKGYDAAYGVSVISDMTSKIVNTSELQNQPRAVIESIRLFQALVLRVPYLSSFLAVVLLVTAAAWASRRRDLLVGRDLRNLRAFWMGAGMYVGTFLIGSNWNYRLIFLLLTIPQLVEWAMGGRGAPRTISIATLFWVFGSLWELVLQRGVEERLAFGRYYAIFVDEAVNWALFACLAALSSASLPRWLQSDVRRWLAQLRGSLSPRRALG